MSRTVEDRLKELGVSLPKPPAPVASYAGFMHHGDLVFVSGQLPLVDGVLSHTGLLGGEVSLEEGAVAARNCAINLVAQMAAALEGDLERIVRCVRLGGFIASKTDFFDQAKVMNGASDFVVDLLGDRGVHARAAVGVAVLPMNASVEVEGLFEIR